MPDVEFTTATIQSLEDGGYILVMTAGGSPAPRRLPVADVNAGSGPALTALQPGDVTPIVNEDPEAYVRVTPYTAAIAGLNGALTTVYDDMPAAGMFAGTPEDNGIVTFDEASGKLTTESATGITMLPNTMLGALGAGNLVPLTPAEVVDLVFATPGVQKILTTDAVGAPLGLSAGQLYELMASVVTAKKYVDAVVTTAVTLATDVANGQSAGGITLVTGMRVLFTGQASAAQNGIRVIAASGTPSRAADSNSAAEVTGSTVFCRSGTSAGTIWGNTTPGTIVLDTTALTWAQVSGSGGTAFTESKEALWIPASAWVPRVTNGARPRKFETTTNDVNFDVLAYATGTDEKADYVFQMPKRWKTGTGLEFQDVWIQETTNATATVTIGLSALALGNDEATDVAHTQTVRVVDDGGTAGDVYVTAWSSALTVAGLADEELVVLTHFRDVDGNGTAANDDLAQDYLHVGTFIKYTVDALGDA